MPMKCAPLALFYESGIMATYYEISHIFIYILGKNSVNAFLFNCYLVKLNYGVVVAVLVGPPAGGDATSGVVEAVVVDVPATPPLLSF